MTATVSPPARTGHPPARRWSWFAVAAVALSLPAVVLLVVVARVRWSQVDNDAVVYPVCAAVLILPVVVAFALRLTLLRLWRRLGTVLGVGMATGLALAATAWAVATPLDRTARVAVPAASASAQSVLAAEIQAMDAHDMATVCALTRPGSAAAQGCSDDETISVRLLHLGTPERVDQEEAPGIDPTTVDIPASLDWRLRSQDKGTVDGVTVRFFDLARTGPQGAWRITGVGTGP